MRILHLTPSFYPAHRYGGPVVSLYELCRAQLAAGHEVRVLTSDAAGRDEGGEGAQPLRLSQLGGRWSSEYGVPTFYGRVRFGEDIAPGLTLELVRQLRWAEVVHITALWSATSLMALGLTLAARRTCVLSPRGSLLPWALAQGQAKKALLLRGLRPILRRVAGWHATSEVEAEAIRQLSLVGKSAKLAVIANGVSIDDAQSQVATSRARPTGRVVVLGRVHPVKNLELAIEALHELIRTEPQATLTVVGPESASAHASASYGAKLRALAAERGLSNRVRFLGLKTGADKQRLLAEADVLWLCSQMESFGNVVLEALAAGTPVVAATTTPWQALDKLGVGHWVAPNAAAFTAATQKLLDEQRDETARAALMARCRQAVAARYAWSRIADEMAELYRAALAAQ